MGFTCIRTATDEDDQRLSARAWRFLARHPEISVAPYLLSVPVDCSGAALALALSNACYEWDSNHPYSRKLSPLWRMCARRALRSTHADQIAYGHVGYSVK